MTCADLEILLCDYQDGTLRSEERALVEAHLVECEECTELAQDISRAVAFVERVAPAEPPPELLTRILLHAPGGKSAAMGRPSWWRRIFGNWLGGTFEAVLQPRYAMGMAMTILSFSMVARYSGIHLQQLKPADLDPVKIWATTEDRAHRVWDRGMKYYENLRWVIELQARIHDLSEQEQEQKKLLEQKAPKPVGGEGSKK